MTQIKICGLKTPDDIEIVNELKPEYAGFVMFYPKSHRNITPDTAKRLLSLLSPDIKSVAVTVSPTAEQLEIAKSCGFDLVQIHGKTDDEVIKSSPLPVLRAFNVSDIAEFDRYTGFDSVNGFLFDSRIPGSGKTFDWSLLPDIKRGDRLFVLAGGLNPDNVYDAVKEVRPDAVDVSTGVENESGEGKSREKAQRFISQVKRADSSL